MNYTNAHELHMHESDIGVERRQNVSMSWQWEPTEKIHYYIYIEVISIRGSKILGDAPRIFLLHVDCVLRTLPGVRPLLPSPFANMLDLLQGRTSLKQLLPLAVHYT